MKVEKVLAKDVQQTILESISDGVFTVDHQWRITSFNRAAEEITGILREKAIGSYCWDVFRSNMCHGNCALKRTMKEGKSFVSSSTYIINSKDEQVPIAVSTSPLVNDDGDILGGVETFRDHSLVEELRRELVEGGAGSEIVSRAEAMKRILNILPRVAESDSTVLIQGETGTGKELLARNIHSLSARKDTSFTAINCGALPDTLLESELFGFKAGAFTGADKDKPGLFAVAGNGTILLDEIGDTSLAFQVRLLRVLEEREYQPLGGVEKIRTEARVLAATNRDLEEMIQQGTFRQDLYYRINIIRLELPPLRDRKEDIPILLEKFIRRMNVLKGGAVNSVDTRVMSVLRTHDYPGNIRELENIIEHAFVLCRNGDIGIEHLPVYLQDDGVPSVRSNGPTVQDKPLGAAVRSTEGAVIMEALKRNGYNRKATAAELCMHKSTLYRKINKLKISLPEFDGRSHIK